MKSLALFVGLYVGTLVTATGVGTGSTVGLQSVVEQPVQSPTGGSQGVEGYVRATHDRGDVRLLLGTIGNIELGQGVQATVTEARALQGGLVVTGPGRTTHATSLALLQPRAHSSYHGVVNVDRVDYITFDNGWSIRPAGDQLQLCNPMGTCRNW